MPTACVGRDEDRYRPVTPSVQRGGSAPRVAVPFHATPTPMFEQLDAGKAARSAADRRTRLVHAPAEGRRVLVLDSGLFDDDLALVGVRVEEGLL